MTLDKLKSMKKNIKIITENCNATIFLTNLKQKLLRKQISNMPKFYYLKYKDN